MKIKVLKALLMLDTSELELIYSAAYHQWIGDQEEHVRRPGETVCDFCSLPPTDGCFHSVPGENGREYLVCKACFQPLLVTPDNGRVPGQSGDRDVFSDSTNRRWLM